ncbi:hypothetical protein GCM10022281_24550 [Sphingomonas rosea]|jgi:GNAT superfamily N-acetyltransferase|uniref:N-acetyltransferase domain-containing protein n=1 Tax=Sphingomonas rosea TaxID=335605 RepID=A0ABP7UFW0_9SPHN
MTPTIRRATVRDVPAMHAIRKAARENRLSETTLIREASYLPYIASGSSWIAEDAAGMLGFAAVDAQARWVWALFVRVGAEGAGVGQALHERILSWARSQGIANLSLSTEEGSRAIKFYGRAGWQRTQTGPDGEVFFRRAV